jgi:hypothetical protein
MTTTGNEQSIFQVLSSVNVNGHTEKKNGLTYLSWAWAWAEIKKAYPNALYTIYENADGWCYHTDGRTAWVKTGVTIEGIEYIEHLPVMDHRNKSIPLESITSFDVNKAIQRSLTKACARHGLGLYIYAGEDLPDGEAPEKPAQPARRTGAAKAANSAASTPASPETLMWLDKCLATRTEDTTRQVLQWAKVTKLTDLTEQQARTACNQFDPDGTLK